MTEKYLVAMVKDGKLDELGVNTLEAYADKFTPLVESDPRRAPISFQLGDGEDLTQRVQREYSGLCDSEDFCPGPFGDFLEIFEAGDGNYFMKVSRKAFPKPALAADLIFMAVPFSCSR